MPYQGMPADQRHAAPSQAQHLSALQITLHGYAGAEKYVSKIFISAFPDDIDS
jgi:hypothetical protein